MGSLGTIQCAMMTSPERRGDTRGRGIYITDSEDDSRTFYDWKMDRATWETQSDQWSACGIRTVLHTFSRSSVTSGATRMYSWFQKSYFELRSSSMKVTRAPHGCGRCTKNRSSRTFVRISLNWLLFTSTKRWSINELNQCVWALG